MNHNIPKIIEKITIGLEKNPIFHDFADYAPFLLAFNQNEFIDKQIDTLKKIIDKYGMFVKEGDSSYRLTDNYEILFGLVDIYKLNNDNNTLRLLEDLLNICLDRFVINNKIISSRNIKSNIPSFRVSYYCYSIVEVLVDMYEITNKTKYLDTARDIIFKFFKSPFYVKHNLIPLGSYLFFEHPLSRIRFPRTSFIGKNTSLIFGLIEYYRITNDSSIKDELDKIFNSIDKNMVRENVIFRVYRPKGNKLDSPNLAAAFMYMNMLNRGFYILKNKVYLERSEAIADIWIKLQGNLGLFPFNIDGSISWIDSETDFTIALLELYELTGNNKYYNAAKKCYDGINKYNLEFSSVDINTGSPCKNIYLKSYRTTDKFSGLFLKLCYYFENDKQIYGDDGLYSLLRDR